MKTKKIILNNISGGYKMTKEAIYEKLNDIFRDIFMDDTINVTPETSSSDIDDWDSLMHITLVSEVEASFNVSFGAKQAAKMKNVGEMVDIIVRLKSNE